MRRAVIPIASFLGIAFLAVDPALGRTGQTVIDDTILARVDDEPVTVGDLLVLLASQRRPEPGTELRITADGVLKRLIQNRLMEQEGLRLGLDQEPTVKGQVDDFTRHRSMIALLDSLQATVPEPEPEAYVPAKPLTSTMLRVSHILVDKKAEAEALRDSLAAGTPFAELAQRHSLDTQWANDEGDLGWSREDKFIPEFLAALQSISQGDVSEPVETAQGWHLLKVTEMHTETIASSEAMAADRHRTAMTERVMAKIRAYVDSLKEKYAVTENDSLLATLDYAAEDPAVLRTYQDSAEVLAVLPWREITVGDLTRQMRFEHFHGLRGKADAPEIRDRLFDEWITELLLRHEAIVLGFHRTPLIELETDRVRRELLREEVGKMILDVDFDPGKQELERYYREHQDRFSSAPGLRAEGVLLADEESARRFRQRLEAGARLRWLADRTPEIRDGSPAFLEGWVQAAELGIEEDAVAPGALGGPFRRDGGWLVARVLEVQPGQPTALEECLPEVVGRMKSDLTMRTMQEALTRLEDASSIRLEDDALDRVREHIDRWLQTNGAGTVRSEAHP